MNKFTGNLLLAGLMFSGLGPDRAFLEEEDRFALASVRACDAAEPKEPPVHAPASLPRKGARKYLQEQRREIARGLKDTGLNRAARRALSRRSRLAPAYA